MHSPRLVKQNTGQLAAVFSMNDKRDKTLDLVFCWKHVPFGCLLTLFILADFLIATVVDESGDEQGGVLLGVTFSQVVLFAAWATLGPARLLTRTLTSFLAVMLLALSLVACVYRMGTAESEWMWFGIVMSQWIVVQLPLWVFRVAFAWRLSWPNEEAADRSQSDTQFGIGQLMVWTALVAVSLGVGRLLMPEELHSVGHGPREEITIFSVITIFNSLLAWPVVWSCYAPRWWGAWLLGAAACVVGLTLVEILTFQTAMGPGRDAEIFWIMNPMQAGLATITLLMMRLAGFRLMRAE